MNAGKVAVNFVRLPARAGFSAPALPVRMHQSSGVPFQCTMKLQVRSDEVRAESLWQSDTVQTTSLKDAQSRAKYNKLIKVCARGKSIQSLAWVQDGQALAVALQSTRSSFISQPT